VSEKTGKKKYLVAFEVHGTHIFEVEAESAEEARQIAQDEACDPTVCHECSDEVDGLNLGEIVDVWEREPQKRSTK
jgi:hypothetical protein